MTSFPRLCLAQLSSQHVYLLAALFLTGIFALIGAWLLNDDRHQLEEQMLRQGRQQAEAFDLALRLTEQSMLQIATLVAKDEQVNALFLAGVKAVRAEGGDAGAAGAAAARDALLSQFAEPWRQLRQEFGLRQLHWHIGPGSLSFLRIHAPDKFGDRMDGLRYTVVDTIATGTARTGLETGRVFTGIRGVAPIIDPASGHPVGAVEAGTDFTELLRILDEELETGLAIMLRREHIDNTVWQDFLDQQGGPLEPSCGCYIEASSRPQLFDLLRAGLLRDLPERPPFFLAGHGGRTYSFFRIPLYDYVPLHLRGQKRPPIGSILFWQDRSELLAQEATRQHQVLLVLGVSCLSAIMLVILLMARARRKLEREAHSMAEGLANARLFRAELADALSDGLLVTDPHGTIVDANARAGDICGTARASLIGKDARLLPGAASMRLSDGRDVFAAGRAWQADLPCMLPDGRERLLHVSVNPVRDTHGQLTGYVALQRDITHQHQQQLAVAASQRMLQSIIDTAPLAIWMEDGEGHAVLTNATCRQWLGDQPRLPPTGGLAPPREVGVDCADGQRRTLQQAWAELDGHSPASSGLVFAALDVTESRRSRQELEERVRAEVARTLEAERLLIQQSRLAAMGEMIGNIAHQWRQPLNALSLLLANVGDARDYGELTDDHLDDSIRQGQMLINRMSTTIDDFRNFFCPDKHSERFRPLSAVEDTLNIVGASYRNHGIAVTIGGDTEATVWGHPNEYMQVVLNLLTNARDALLEREVRTPRIEVLIRIEGPDCCLTVADNAGGMAPEVLERAFDPYFTTKDQGTGIGLYMSRMIIERNMGGRILAENGAEGARITICCPTRAPEEKTGPEASAGGS